jgi:hypothetical protein
MPSSLEDRWKYGRPPELPAPFCAQYVVYVVVVSAILAPGN